MGLTFKCGPEALIPRPETEGLVQLVTEKVEREASGIIYDVGTGSGVIAISLAANFEKAKVIGIDIDETALSLAKENGERHSEYGVVWKRGDLLTDEQKQTESVLAVVANLPYLTTEEMTKLDFEVQQDPIQALDGGDNGLDMVRPLIQQASELTEWIFLEIGIAQGQEVSFLLQEAGFKDVAIEQDLTDRDRYVWGRREP